MRHVVPRPTPEIRPWPDAQPLRSLPLLMLMALVVALTSGCALIRPTPAKTDATRPSEPAIRVVLEAPDELKPLLEQNLDLSRLQQLRDDEAPDDTEWARLINAAPAQVRELLQTEGYFNAEVTVRREPGKPAIARVRVLPGPRARVALLQVDTRGALQQRVAAGDADALALQTVLRGTGPLKTDAPFRNADWADTKQLLLTRLRAAGYAAARIGQSQADIDIQAHTALLKVVLDSGPLFLAGPLLVEGLKAHDEATVRNLAGFAEGDALTEARLLDYQDRLQKAGLFERATVSYEPDESQAAAMPVRISLAELPLRQATVGLGVSANTGPRASIEHTHRRAFGLPISAYNKLEWGRDNQAWTGDFYSHPGEGFYRNLLGVQISRIKSDSDVVLSQRLRLGRTQDTPRIERLYFAELLHSSQSTQTTAGATALSGNYHLVWRQLDSVLLPTRGITVSLQTGAGEAVSPGGDNGPFARLYGRLTGYLPLGDQWFGQARIEAGQVFKRDSVQVPDALGFRAGGDDSVRGYAYRALAPSAGANTVRSGLMLLTGSVEVARPISPKMPSVWGAVFIDAGRAVDRWADYSAAVGLGVGVRWRSPIGPLRVDLAWADELQKLRLHLSVGIAF